LNLKLVLMELGNQLVTRHGWEPDNGHAFCRINDKNTGLIAAITHQINSHQDMQDVLFGLTGEIWEVPNEKEVVFEDEMGL